MSEFFMKSFRAEVMLKRDTFYIVSPSNIRTDKQGIALPLRTAVARYLFLFQGKLVIVCEFFTSRNMSLCVYENLFLPLNTYDLCIAIRLDSTNQHCTLIQFEYNPQITSCNIFINYCNSYLTRMIYKSSNPSTLGSINLKVNVSDGVAFCDLRTLGENKYHVIKILGKIYLM